jgi:ribA/ribD-fused uncharacterized protein
VRFRGKYSFLSNFYNSPIVYKDKVYSTAEHLFQCCKTESEKEREWIRTAHSPAEAKGRGRKVSLRNDWNKIKVNAMRGVLKLKFKQNKDLLKRLMEIEGEIVEDNEWNDKYWGKCNGVGKNVLGKLLMEIRDNGIL